MLGFKAPLAYSSSFYFVCRKGGMERKYMMYEGEETNTIDLLYEKATTERNGVKVIVPVSYYDSSDFKRKTKEQLAYFQNVYFNVEGIRNDFSIFRGQNYQASELSEDRSMHICLDDVYYPIDWKKLDMRELNLRVGIRFSLTDGIFPTPNRESIRYTVEAKEKIKAKIGLLADEFVKKYNEDVKDSADFETVFQFYNNKIIQVKSPINDQKWLDITELSKHASIPLKSPKLDSVQLLDASKLVSRSRYIMQEYQYRHVIRTGYKKQFCNFNGTWDREMTFNSYGKKLTERKIYLFENTISERSKRYIKETFKEEAYFVKRVAPMKLWKTGKDVSGTTFVVTDDYSTYYGLLDLHKHPRSEWRQRINEFQNVVDGIVKTFLNFEDIVIPEAWIIADKKSRSKAKVKVDGDGYVKVKGDINGKIAKDLERYVDQQNCKFVPNIWKGTELHRTKSLVVYGRDTDKSTLDKWYAFIKKGVDFVILSEREIKTLESYKLSNWMPVSKFLEGKNKPYRKAISIAAINKLKNSHQDLFGNRNYDWNVSHIVNGLTNDLEELSNYRSQYTPTNNISDDDITAAIEAGNADPNIHDVYTRVKILLEKHPFISTMAKHTTWGRKHEEHKIVKHLCRYRHVRMSKECYKLTSGWQPVDSNGQLSLLLA